MPPSAGDSTVCGAKRSHDGAKRGTERLGFTRMLQHQRALQIAGAVQPGGQSEVAFEQGAGLSENRQNFGFSHRIASISGR